MNNQVRGTMTVIGRIMLSLVFLMSAIGNKIPNFSQVAKYMSTEGVAASQLMLVGAIVFLIAGSLSVIVGYKARIGATLLLVFLLQSLPTITPDSSKEDPAPQTAARPVQVPLGMMLPWSSRAFSRS